MLEENIKLAQSYFDYANSLIPLGQFNAAVESYSRAISINPNFVDAYINLGSVLVELNQLKEAIKNYDCAIRINPDYMLAYVNRGFALNELKQFEAAIQSYDRAIAINPHYADAYFKRANAQQALGKLAMAVEDYDRAVALDSSYASAFDNRGLALNELNQLEAAVESHSKAIAINPNKAEAYVHRGNALVDLNQLEAAVKDYERAITIKPNFDYLLGTLLQTKMKVCDWSDFIKNTGEMIKRIERGEKTSPTFALHYLSHSASIQRKGAEIFAKYERPFDDSLGKIPKRKRANKIRIGYFSADFRVHAVSILLAELFEYHDKNGFELVAFSFGPDIKDAMRHRLENAFDQFVDIRDLSDKEAALLARQMNIDIAIDLGGDTANSRSRIFSYRAAPIQVGYIGYLGTMGADYFDYLIADQIIIPKESQPHYVEKIVYLPSYQANDTKRKISDKLFSREALGLPDVGFIFCCFNNNFKITPTIFDSWMRILKTVNESVLFLFADNDVAKKNLRKEAKSRGVDSSRLIFGERLPPSDYLARYKVADLFLDTFPYNAGTTASDALWAGLPLLTLLGETFANRVAASLLTAIELPELITQSPEDYEALAIELATDPVKLNMIKAKLAANRLSTPLFNTTLFTKHLENAYIQMVDRYHADLKPDHIYVEVG